MNEMQKDIVDTAVGAGTFTTLVTALQQDPAWVEMLKGDGPFTVFAPNDDAFKKTLEMAGMTAEQLVADKVKLGKILTYHVVQGKAWMAADVMALPASAEVTSVEGHNLTVKHDDTGVWVNTAKVIQADIACSNGVIHVIDSVLMPPEDGMAAMPAPAEMPSEAPMPADAMMPAAM